jgi:hypothetical protein
LTLHTSTPPGAASSSQVLKPAEHLGVLQGRRGGELDFHADQTAGEAQDEVHFQK